MPLAIYFFPQHMVNGVPQADSACSSLPKAFWMEATPFPDAGETSAREHFPILSRVEDKMFLFGFCEE